MTNSHSPTPDKNKDIIYVDAEDDITGIIEHVQASNKRLVALVLPKRFATMQSIVNMKLLKRASERAKKHIVLITSEASLLPLAGNAGIYVAKSLQSKPEIPEAPLVSTPEKDTLISEDESEALPGADETPVDKTKTLSELSGDEEAPIELDNAEAAPSAAAASAGKKSKPKKDKKLKIPNFNKFRTLLIFGGIAAAILIGVGIWAFIALPKANILIATDSMAATSDREVTLIASDSATLQAEDGIVPAQKAEITRTQRQEVQATGEENKGKNATGSVTMTVEDCSSQVKTPKSVPAGTGISSGGNTHVTQKSASFTPDDVKNGCVIFKSDKVSIVAQNPGTASNTGNGSSDFSVAGRSDVTASGSAKGGTDDIVKVVTQEDVDKAKEQIKGLDSDEIKQELSEKLQDEGLFAVEATFTTNSSDSETSAEIGDEASAVTVTEEVTYTMLGVKQTDLEAVVLAAVSDEIDSERQTILSYGLEEATFTLQNQQDDETLLGVHSKVVAGPDIDTEAIKQAVAGLKASEAKPIIEEYPGVTNVDITYGPFWVSKIPSSTSKISVTIEEPQVVDPNAETE